MDIPRGIINQTNSRKVCRLAKRSLYGLKQSPQPSYDRFGSVIKQLGFVQGQADRTMLYKHSEGGKLAILIVYVDDIIITGNDTTELENVRKRLAKEFEIKELGQLKYFLGMEVARNSKGIALTQRKYAPDLLKKT